jgi:hypothetical protein
MLRIDGIREWLRLRLWFVPALFVIAAGLLAVALMALDRYLVEDPGPLGFAFG